MLAGWGILEVVITREEHSQPVNNRALHYLSIWGGDSEHPNNQTEARGRSYAAAFIQIGYDNTIGRESLALGDSPH